MPIPSWLSNQRRTARYDIHGKLFTQRRSQQGNFPHQAYHNLIAHGQLATTVRATLKPCWIRITVSWRSDGWVDKPADIFCLATLGGFCVPIQKQNSKLKGHKNWLVPHWWYIITFFCLTGGHPYRSRHKSPDSCLHCEIQTQRPGRLEADLHPSIQPHALNPHGDPIQPVFSATMMSLWQLLCTHLGVLASMVPLGRSGSATPAQLAQYSHRRF